MTATERLRELLDERGVEWAEYGDGYTLLRHGGREYTVQPNVCNRLIVTNLTPEQAIAATLGRRMLTADDVRDLIERHSDASGGNGRDFHNGAYVAIANELNSTLGSSDCTNNCTNGEQTGTCNADETETWECVCDQIGRYGKRVTVHVMECSECGHTYEHVNGDYEYCPHCGRRVVEVDA